MADHYEVLKRFNEEVFGKGRVDLIDELVHEDYVEHSALGDRDRDGLKQFVEMTYAALSDVDATLQRVVVSGDDAAWRWRMTGRHTGEWMGIPATGAEIDVTGTDIGVMREGKIAEQWGDMDMLALFSQLGLVEPPPLG